MPKSPSYDDVVADDFEEVKGEFSPTHDFNETDTFVGVYTGKTRTVTTRNGDRAKHIFETPDGQVELWPAAILDSRLKDVPVGAKVKVVNTGRKVPTKSGRNAAEYQVFVAKGSLKASA